MTKEKIVEEKKDEFVFDEKTHSYTLGGKKMTGVTTVIGVLAKPALIGWAAKMAIEYVKDNGEVDEEGEYHVTPEILEHAKSAHTRKKEEAGTHGTDAHSLIEEYINFCLANKGKPFALGKRAEIAGIKQFVDWAVKDVDNFLFAERRMFNKEMFVAGTADFGCVLKTGQKLMGDFKTSSGIYGIDYYLQCAGYKILAEGEGDKPYSGCVITRLGKDGSFEATYSYDTKTAEDAFKACLVIYRAQAALKETASSKTP